MTDLMERLYFSQTTKTSYERLQATFYSNCFLQNGGHKENGKNKHMGY